MVLRGRAVKRLSLIYLQELAVSQIGHIRALPAARYDGADMIHVCSLARLHTTIEETGARHVVTLLGVEDEVRLPDAVPALNPARDEQAIAQALRRASHTAYPNPRIVRLADQVLDRHGRMVAAVEAIG